MSPGDQSTEYWYRPRQMLVHPDDLRAVPEIGSEILRVLERWRAVPFGPPGEPGRDSFRSLNVLRFELPASYTVPAAVASLRDQFGQRFSEANDGRTLRVSPNHVFGAAPKSGFGPGDAAEATSESIAVPQGRGEGPFVVGVLDTGLVADPGANPRFQTHMDMALDSLVDADLLDREPADGMLDDADAHGGFVADIVRLLAPQAVVRVGKVLLGGIADEVQIGIGIRRLMDLTGAHVLNLSLYGNTAFNDASWPLADVLDRLDPRPVVVAAVGNHAESRPTWPAAIPADYVIGVAAVDAPDGQAPTRAAFTNFGPWVKACAHGVGVLGPFVTFEERKPVPGQDPVTDLLTSPQTFTGFCRWSGTSFAAPRVAARIVERAATLLAGVGGDRYAAVHQAAQGLLAQGPPVPDLGVFVP